MSVKVQVPGVHHRDELIANYAGAPVVYKLIDGQAEVEERHLDEFLMAFEGSSVVPPQVAEPVVTPQASKEKK